MPPTGRVFLSVSEATGLVQGDASVAPTDIDCDGSANVEIKLIGQNSIQENPADVMLVLDRSGSMTGQPLADLKNAASTFIDLIDEASDGSKDGYIDGSQVGVVSFDGGSSAYLTHILSHSVSSLKTAINNLTAYDGTRAAPAINLAQSQLSSSTATMRIMIIVSDGQTSYAPAASSAAAAARAAGTEIFTIGFGSYSATQLNDWATDPDADHAFFNPTSSELQQTFEEIGAKIITPGGTNITLEATVSDPFAVSNQFVDKGTLSLVGNVLTWTIAELGDETVTLSFTATHDNALLGGPRRIVLPITYIDDEGNDPTFPILYTKIHGCAAAIDLQPETETNELFPGQEHTVTAIVTDDFGDPVESVPVEFDISAGPNAGGSASGITDGDGEVSFTYSATQGLAGLGTDEMEACFTIDGRGPVCDDALKDWVDTTPPDVSCPQGMNPDGTIPPPDNPDGFFLLEAFDLVDPDPQIYVNAGGGVIFGPFPNGTNVKYAEAPGKKPKIMPGPLEVDWIILGTEDMMVFGVDASGNQSTLNACLVPPPPKAP